ncbi:hydrolase [Trinickia sp. LjRoot230]|uniref:DAPG hydrolase family protein n=1 Tax=Trinickia sp. LjRoot230 TaxID=3342288 RepID=UPI003ED11B81
MKLDEVDLLLDAAPLQLETGYERLSSGVLHVGCRTHMQGCTGEMFEWWFRSRPNTQQYRWWHPVDHVSSEWAGGETQTHVGSVHLVEERFTDLPAARLAIHFRDATEFFNSDRYRTARSEKRVTAAVCACVAMGHDPESVRGGHISGSRLLHIGRDTPGGLVLRSHFYLGQDLPATGKKPDEIIAMFSDEFGRALLMHCYNEFTFLSRFLPALYLGDNRDKVNVPLPW